MVKVSVVMPVYNAARFLKESVNSILNQTLDDLELICVDDGSTDNSLDMLNSFDDSRVKVYSLDHQGGGNARNYGLGKITGEYLFCMDADDVLDLNAFEKFYEICVEKNLDFLVFKAINYGVEKGHFFETEYQNMTRIYNKVGDNVFSYKDLGNLLFDFNVSPWCKFYNSEFVKSTHAKFRENSKFHDNQFFWDIIFQAKRIYFINEFFYTRKRYDQSLTASGDIGHIDMIDIVNDIIKLFVKHEQLDNYKHTLYNLKITWITDRYNQIQEKFKAKFFKKMKYDYLSLKTKEFPKLLDEDKRFIYDCVIISKNYNEFDLIKKYYEINKNDSCKEINELNNKILNAEKTINELNKIIQSKEKTINKLENRIEDKENSINELNNIINDNTTIIKHKENTITGLNENIQSKEKTINELENKIDEYKKTINRLKDDISENTNIINHKENTITELNNTIKTKENTISKLENNIKNNEKAITDLINTIENKDKTLTELHSQINGKNEIIKNNDLEISKLETKNKSLTEKNEYLKDELEQRFSVKKLFKE